MSIDVIGDFLTIIRNGIMVSKPSVTVPHSKLRMQIAELLKTNGFIRDVSIVDGDAVKKEIKIVLKYVDRESVIHEIKRVSRPGLRAYSGVKKIKPVIGGLGVTVLSTSRGVMTQSQAKALNIGGEVICTVW